MKRLQTCLLSYRLHACVVTCCPEWDDTDGTSTHQYTLVALATDKLEEPLRLDRLDLGQPRVVWARLAVSCDGLVAPRVDGREGHVGGPGPLLEALDAQRSVLVVEQRCGRHGDVCAESGEDIASIRTERCHMAPHTSADSVSVSGRADVVVHRPRIPEDEIPRFGTDLDPLATPLEEPFLLLIGESCAETESESA